MVQQQQPVVVEGKIISAPPPTAAASTSNPFSPRAGRLSPTRPTAALGAMALRPQATVIPPPVAAAPAQDATPMTAFGNTVCTRLDQALDQLACSLERMRRRWTRTQVRRAVCTFVVAVVILLAVISGTKAHNKHHQNNNNNNAMKHAAENQLMRTMLQESIQVHREQQQATAQQLETLMTKISEVTATAARQEEDRKKFAACNNVAVVHELREENRLLKNQIAEQKKALAEMQETFSEVKRQLRRAKHDLETMKSSNPNAAERRNREEQQEQEETQQQQQQRHRQNQDENDRPFAASCSAASSSSSSSSSPHKIKSNAGGSFFQSPRMCGAVRKMKTWLSRFLS